MKEQLIRCVAAVIAVAAVSGACHGGPTGPTQGGAVPVRLDIEGPRNVPPGGTSRMTATAHFADGSTRDVTGSASWRSGDPSVLSFPQPGLSLGLRVGDSTISVGFNFTTATREVIVTPAGTFRLTGRVSEAGSSSLPIADAAIEVPGALPDARATTDNEGRYRLFGVPGTTDLRVSKGGYHTRTERLVLTDHGSRDFELALLSPRPDLAGTYTLTISAAPECVGLPEAARRRTYAAVLTQTGAGIEAALSGASFAALRSGKGSRLHGNVEPDGVTFRLTQYDQYYKGYGQPYADLVEMLESSMFLVVDGTATLSLSSRGLAGRLSGRFQVFSADPRWAPPLLARCSSLNHGFVLSR